MMSFALLSILSAAAAGKPQISAAEVTSKTTNSATFLIGINANVAQTTVTIQYNTSGNFTDPILTAQVGVTTGLVNYTPTITGLQSGTTYYFRVRATNFYGESYSASFNTTTLSGLPPSINNISVSNIKDKQTTINFDISTTNGTVKYDVLVNTSGNFLGQDIGTDAPTTDGGSVSKTITSLNPITKYYYKIIAKSGTDGSQIANSNINNFTTIAESALVLIAEFKFENGYNSESGNMSFTSNSGTSFTTDRNENATGAIRIVNTGATAIIPNLPYSNDERTVSLWAQVNTLRQDYNMLFSYGISSLSNSFGGGLNPTQAMAFGYNNNHNVANANTANTWYHFVFTYNGTTSKIYKNGVLVGSMDKTWNTISNNNLFKIGVGINGELWFDGAIDDLKIYNKELNSTDIASLYVNNVITSIEDITTENILNAYPNPFSSEINFTGYAELYDVLGAKVAEGTNVINVANITEGVYVLKTKISTVKLIKN